MTRQILEKSQWNSLSGWMIGVAAIALSTPPVLAQPVPDDTLGDENSQVIINGPIDFDIDGGARRGANLFHSFQDFNVDTGGSVYFLNPDGVENILSRVTGNNPSNILGILGVRGDANLFFMNPNGILFGEESQLDVQGSFVGTTANAIGFGNQGLFSASTPEVPSTLLTVNPSAFFFNQVSAGAIAINSRADAGPDPSDSFDTFGLRVPDGRSLLLLGGDITADGGGLVAFAGRIQLASIADTGSVNLDREGSSLRLNIPDNLTQADVSLTNDAGFLATTGTTGGSIEITARNINILNGSSIQAGIGRNLGTAGSQAGDIILNAQESLNMIGSDNTVANNVFTGGVGNAGRIVILSGLVNLEDGQFDSVLENNVNFEAQGNTGGISIETNSLFVRNGFQVQSVIFGEGSSGGLAVSARDLIELDGRDEGDFPSGIFSNLEGGIGQAGNISINTRNLNILNRAQIGATTEGRGNAGNITISAQERVFLQSSIIISEVTEDSGIGTGGNIEINTDTLELRDGGSLLADTENIGSAGDVIINANRTVIVAGEGPGPFSADSVIPSQITTTVDRAQNGEGGDIRISTSSLIMSGGARLNSNTSGNGNAGNIFRLYSCFREMRFQGWPW